MQPARTALQSQTVEFHVAVAATVELYGAVGAAADAAAVAIPAESPDDCKEAAAVAVVAAAAEAELLEDRCPAAFARSVPYVGYG